MMEQPIILPVLHNQTVTIILTQHDNNNNYYPTYRLV